MARDLGKKTSVKVAEVDFGATPSLGKSFTVTDTGISADMHVLAYQSGEAATGRQADENEMDQLLVSARAAAGQVVLYVAPVPTNGPVTGKYKCVYRAG